MDFVPWDTRFRRKTVRISYLRQIYITKSHKLLEVYLKVINLVVYFFNRPDNCGKVYEALGILLSSLRVTDRQGKGASGETQL